MTSAGLSGSIWKDLDAISGFSRGSTSSTCFAISAWSSDGKFTVTLLHGNKSDGIRETKN